MLNASWGLARPCALRTPPESAAPWGQSARIGSLPVSSRAAAAAQAPGGAGDEAGSGGGGPGGRPGRCLRPRPAPHPRCRCGSHSTAGALLLRTRLIQLQLHVWIRPGCLHVCVNDRKSSWRGITSDRPKPAPPPKQSAGWVQVIWQGVEVLRHLDIGRTVRCAISNDCARSNLCSAGSMARDEEGCAVMQRSR